MCERDVFDEGKGESGAKIASLEEVGGEKGVSGVNWSSFGAPKGSLGTHWGHLWSQKVPLRSPRSSLGAPLRHWGRVECRNGDVGSAEL